MRIDKNYGKSKDFRNFSSYICRRKILENSKSPLDEKKFLHTVSALSGKSLLTDPFFLLSLSFFSLSLQPCVLPKLQPRQTPCSAKVEMAYSFSYQIYENAYKNMGIFLVSFCFIGFNRWPYNDCIIFEREPSERGCRCRVSMTIRQFAVFGLE